MGAFNVAIQSQNQILRAVFPTKPYLEQHLVTIGDAIYGDARKRAKQNKKGVYAKSPSVGGNATSKQEDVQRGKVEDPVSEKVLMKANYYYLF